jgi:hypothetical protein
MVAIGILVCALFSWTMLTYVRDSRRPMVVPLVTDPSTTNGYTIMLCHRRRSSVGPARLRGEWSRGRAELVGRWREEIGFTAYVQVHQVSRWSVTYNLVVASRAWPIVAFISILHGLPVPRPTAFDRETREEKWDVIEQLDFADREAALSFLASQGAAAARAALADDALTVMRRSQALFLRTSEAFAHENTQPPGCYTLFTLRSRPYLGVSEAMRYWLTHHRPFVVQQQPVVQFCAYYQHVAEHGADIDAAAAALSHAAGAPWDAVASLAHQRFAVLAGGIIDPRVLVANTRLVVDETRFLETQRSALLIGTPLVRIA